MNWLKYQLLCFILTLWFLDLTDNTFCQIHKSYPFQYGTRRHCSFSMITEWHFPQSCVIHFFYYISCKWKGWRNCLLLKNLSCRRTYIIRTRDLVMNISLSLPLIAWWGWGWSESEICLLRKSDIDWLDFVVGVNSVLG